MIEVDAHAALQRLVKRHGSQKAAAHYLGISEPYLSDLLNERREFSDRMLEKLGLRSAVVKS